MYKKIVFLLCWSAAVHSRPFHKFHRLHKIPPDDDMLLFWKTPGPKRCKPFDAFYDKCNRCVCGADGIAFCTRIICSENGIAYEYETEDRDTSEYKKGEKKRYPRKKFFRKRRKHPKDDH